MPPPPLFDLDFGLYFTFHEVFNIITTTNINRNILLTNLNNVLNNLYNNNQFIDLIDNNDNFKNIMDDICDKTDILTEKYMNKNMCSVFMDELCNRCIIYSKTVVNAYNRIRKPISVEPSISDESSSDDEVDGFPSRALVFFNCLDTLRTSSLSFILYLIPSGLCTKL